MQIKHDSTTETWVLITGAGKRVGADIARYFASQGFNLIIHYHSSQDEAEALKNEIVEKYAVKVALVAGDLSKEADVKAIFTKHSPDIVINNAARFAEDNYHANIDANTTATFLVSQQAIERMLADKKRGTIFLVGDAFIANGGVYSRKLSAYTMSKSAIPELVSALAANYGKSGIRVIGILNGPIEPPPTASAEVIASVKAEINLPDEDLHPWIGGRAVGEAIFLLFSIHALNGESVRIDGGRRWLAPREH